MLIYLAHVLASYHGADTTPQPVKSLVVQFAIRKVERFNELPNMPGGPGEDRG
jgi:hypothetical protein